MKGVHYIMQNQKFEQITIMIPVPMEAVEISGILDEPVIKVTATEGKLVLEAVDCCPEAELER